MTEPVTEQRDRDLLEDLQLRDDAADHIGEDKETEGPGARIGDRVSHAA